MDERLSGYCVLSSVMIYFDEEDIPIRHSAAAFAPAPAGGFSGRILCAGSLRSGFFGMEGILEYTEEK